MSRHRNVRSMNYTDEYDGYDDVYGHSVEDDYCVSPSQAAFMYDREGPKAKPKIGAFFERDHDIAEENEDAESKESNLSDIDRVRLETCIEHIKQNVNITSSKQELVDAVLLCNFNVEKSLKFLLNVPEVKDNNKQEKDVIFSLKGSTSTKKGGFTIPKLNTTKFAIPKFSIAKGEDYKSLADLTSSHLNSVTPNELDDVTKTISSITFDDNKPKCIKSLHNFETNTLSDSSRPSIDLTKALRVSKSAPQVRVLPLSQDDSEPFVPQFVDCERDDSFSGQSIHPSECCMDIRKVLKVKRRLCKRPSRFGKIICALYKTSNPQPNCDDNSWSPNIDVFKFDSPSPDDLVRLHLCRK